MALVAALVLLPRDELARAHRLRTAGPKILSLSAVLRSAVEHGLRDLEAPPAAEEPTPTEAS